MFQLTVRKQGKLSITSFSDRIATVDVAQRCVFLSRKRHPEILRHHKLFVQRILFWPDFNKMRIDESFHGKEAMLTIQVDGIERKKNKKNNKNKNKNNKNNKNNKMRMVEVDSVGDCPLEESQGKETSWILRAPTVEALEELIFAFSFLFLQKNILQDSSVFFLKMSKHSTDTTEENKINKNIINENDENDKNNEKDENFEFVNTTAFFTEKLAFIRESVEKASREKKKKLGWFHIG